jgi:GxxExxY protein
MTQKEDYLHSDVTGKILQSFYLVYNGLGIGFSKKMYINSLMHEFKKLGLSAESNKTIEIFYQQIDIGDIQADILVNGIVLLAIDTNKEIVVSNGQILYNKLCSSIYEVGLLLNFGDTPEHIRKIFTNDRKANLS